MRLPLPYLTDSQLRIGGRLKVQCSDFVVEEIPAYAPSGEGEHLYLFVEKTDRSAEQLVAHLARSLHVRRQEIGMAGLKDRFAITRQWVSAPARAKEYVGNVESDQFRVLSQSLHRNKLHSGHTRGNRFDILVREVVDRAEPIARRIAEQLSERGAPNFFGQQRFGISDETLQLGLDLLTKRRTQTDIPAPRRKFLTRLAISAAQSAVFNEVLARRIEAGTLQTVRSGDVMQVRRSGGAFVAEDVAREQQRFDAGETVPTGPLFGPKLLRPGGIAADEESAALGMFGLQERQFNAFPKLAPGARRAMLAWPADLEVLPDPGGLRFRMTLPAGVYATVVLREFIKRDGASGPDTRDA